MLEFSPLQTQDAQYVQEVMRAGQHLLQLIDEVLDLAGLEAGRTRLDLEPIALQAIVDACMRLMQPAAQVAGVTLECPGPPLEVMVSADAGRLKQVLLNLLSNAIKYNRRGGRVLLSICPCDDDEAAWELGVADTGAGLTEEQIGRLFKPFERLDAARSGIQGAGIGLALSHRLVALMGGSLQVESAPGKGSRFVLRLQRAYVASAATRDLPALFSSEPAASAAAAARRHRVLHVEDNLANQRLMAGLFLSRADIDLRTASTAGEALLLAPGFQPDLLLIDIQLPDGDGHSLLKELRTQGVQAPAAAVSANAMPADVERGLLAGFAEYLTKPLDLARVLQVVDALIGESPAVGRVVDEGR